MPLRASSSASRVHLADHERHVRVHPPGARVVDRRSRRRRRTAAPAPARSVAPAREQRDVEAGADRRSPRPRPRSPRRGTAASCPPSGRRRRSGSARSGSPAPRAAGASRRRPGRSRRRRRPAVPLIVPVPRRRRPPRRASSPNAVCTAHARRPCTESARVTTEMRISLVEIISMLMPASDSARNSCAETPEFVRIPAPTSASLPIWSSCCSVR